MAKLSQPPSLALRWQAALDDHVIALAWSPDGTRLAAASVSGPIALFDTATGKPLHTLSGHGFGTTSIAWQPGGFLLASSGQDGKVRLWDTNTGQQHAEMSAEIAWVERVSWNPNGTNLVSAGGKKMRLWNLAGELVRNFPDHPATIADIGWSRKGQEFITACYGCVTFWKTDVDEPHNRFLWKGSILAVAWSPDGKFIAGGGQDASVHFWNVKTGKDLEMTGYPQKVRELSWDATSTFLATGGGNQVTIWNCSRKGPAGTAPISYELHEMPLSQVAFHNRGPLLASACTGGLLALWLPGGSKKVLAQTRRDEGLAQLQWSPDDRRLAVGGDAGFVGLFVV